jgi:hypothetical protein
LDHRKPDRRRSWNPGAALAFVAACRTTFSMAVILPSVSVPSAP